MHVSTWIVAVVFGVSAGLIACGGSSGSSDSHSDTGGTGGTETGGTGGTDTGGTGGEDDTGGTGGDDPTGGTGGDDPTGGTGGGTGGTGGDAPGGCPVIPKITDAHFMERFEDGVDVAGVVSKPNLSGKDKDIVWYEFWTLDVGTFQFGPGTSNVGPGECDQCFTLALDADEGWNGAKEFIPESGSVEVSATLFDGGGTVWKTVTVKHNEVVFREYDWGTGSVVPEGACYTMKQEVVFE